MSNDENQKNQNDVELLIWMNGKTKEYTFKYKIENISHITLTVVRLKLLLSKYIFENKKIYNLLQLSKKEELIQHLYTKNEVELEDFDIPYLKTNDILFFSFEPFSVYKASNNYYQYEFIKWIKSGGFGKVFLAKEVSTKKEYAIKQTSIQGFSNETIYNLSREYMILKEMSHKNIVKFHTFFTYDNKFYTVMDYARGGELSVLLEEKKKLSEEEAKLIFKQIYNAVCYIHSKNIIHRDLKPNNILFLDEERTHVVIIDFGISGVANGNQRESIKAGTVKFLPPEMLSGKEFSSSAKLDMWALGVILYRMVEGEYPFEGKNNKDNIHNIFKAKLEFNSKIKISTPLRQLIEGLLEKNYRFRIDDDSYLFSKWFTHKIILNNNSIKKKVKKNESIDDDLYNIEYLNKYYSLERYSKYYEDENERKMIQSLSNKVGNSYLSQTKSTSMKIKPKVFYIKNDYSYMKKNSLPYKIELSRANKRKNLEGIHSIDEKENEHENESENEKNDFNNPNHSNIILPLIRSVNFEHKPNSNSSKKLVIRTDKSKNSLIRERKANKLRLHQNLKCYNTNYLDKLNANITINNSELLNNNFQVFSPKYNNNYNLRVSYKPGESNEVINKSSSSFKIKNDKESQNKNLFFLINQKNKNKIKEE